MIGTRSAAGFRLAALGCVALTLALGGCGVTPGSSGGASGAPTSMATSMATSTATSTATLVPVGAVTITLSKAVYATDDTLVVTIYNSLSVPLWSLGATSGCAGIVVQRMDQGVWQAVGDCPATHVIRPSTMLIGSSVEKQITPAEELAAGAGWPTGTYRLAFAYTLSQTVAVSSGTVAYSATFTIQ